jgi:hypothetical protein
MGGGSDLGKKTMPRQQGMMERGLWVARVRARSRHPLMCSITSDRSKWLGASRTLFSHGIFVLCLLFVDYDY